MVIPAAAIAVVKVVTFAVMQAKIYISYWFISKKAAGTAAGGLVVVADNPNMFMPRKIVTLSNGQKIKLLTNNTAISQTGAAKHWTFINGRWFELDLTNIDHARAWNWINPQTGTTWWPPNSGVQPGTDSIVTLQEGQILRGW